MSMSHARPSAEAAICPGQRTTFRAADDAPHILRLLFTVCYENACPNTEEFFSLTPPLSTLGGIDFMGEAALLCLNNPRALSAKFITYHGVELVEPDEYTNRVQPRLLTLAEPVPVVDPPAPTTA